jgi:hypothetical protein
MNVVFKYSSVVALAAVFFAGAMLQAADDHEYVGSKKCRKCHAKEYRSWSTTKMAVSFEVLRPGANAEQKTAHGLDPQKDYTKDAECLPCHTTGFGKKGGFVDEKKTPDLVGVGCEDCHGPGGTYLQDGYMTMENKEYKREELVAVGMVGEYTREICDTCHNTKSPFVGDDYVFDFEAKKAEGMHEVSPLKFKH